MVRKRRIDVAMILIVGVLLTMVPVASCFAGAWTMPEGKLYSKFSLNYYSAEEDFDEDGDRVDFDQHGDFYDVNASVYLEYGLTERLTLVTNLSYKYLEYENDAMTSESFGIGDIDVAAKYLLYQRPGSAVSIQGLLKVPESYDETDDVPLGNGQYDVEFRLLYGQSLYPVIPCYFNLEAGYRFRQEEPADEFRYLVEMGIDVTSKAYGRVKLDGILGMGNEGRNYDASGNPTTTEDYNLGKLDLCLGYKLSATYGVELAYTPALYGENTAAGSTLTIAFVIQR